MRSRALILLVGDMVFSRCSLLVDALLFEKESSEFRVQDRMALRRDKDTKRRAGVSGL